MTITLCLVGGLAFVMICLIIVARCLMSYINQIIADLEDLSADFYNHLEEK